MKPRKRNPSLPGRLTGMPQIISRIPWHPGMSRAELDLAITGELGAIWASRLSKKELLQKTEFDQGKSDELSYQVRSKLDEIILKQAETFGWRLLVSTGVLKRIDEWEVETNGPELFESLGKALAKSVRILQRLALAPIDNPDLIPTQDQTVRQLRTVRREMKKEFSTKWRSPDRNELWASFTRIVSDSRMSCTLLRANIVRWQLFFERNSALLNALVWSKRPAPAALSREWLSWCKGHDPETLRKKISAMRNSLTNR